MEQKPLILIVDDDPRGLAALAEMPIILVTALLERGGREGDLADAAQHGGQFDGLGVRDLHMERRGAHEDQPLPEQTS